MAALVMLQVHGVNGPRYWKWSWREAPQWRLSPWPLYASMLLAAAPFAAAQYIYLAHGRLKIAVALLALATLTLELTALAHQPPVGLRRLVAIVENPINTSYYTDAVVLSGQSNIPVRDWLTQYPDILPLLHLHAKYKPPGLVLYYLLMIKLFGPGTSGAAVGGMGVALLAAAAVPATCWTLRVFGLDEHAAFTGASFFALCPSLILFLPQFDQVYPFLACVILAFWGIAARRGRWLAAIGCGAALALGLFLSYIFLVLGCFILVDWMLLLSDRGGRAFGRATMMGVIALIVIAALYALLNAVSGFDPIATFHAISREQAKDLLPLARPFPRHIFFDLLDLALGTGWISFLLVGFYVLRERGCVFAQTPGNRIVLLALIEIAVVAAAALLPGETARLWLLLMPLLMAPIGFELARWTIRQRMMVYACLWLILVVLCQNIAFVYMGPELDGPRVWSMRLRTICANIAMPGSSDSIVFTAPNANPGASDRMLTPPETR
jgi:hypothetical protein